MNKTTRALVRIVETADSQQFKQYSGELLALLRKGIHPKAPPEARMLLDVVEGLMSQGGYYHAVGLMALTMLWSDHQDHEAYVTLTKLVLRKEAVIVDAG